MSTGASAVCSSLGVAARAATPSAMRAGRALRAALAMLGLGAAALAAQGPTEAYRDPRRAPEARAADLLGRLTLEEKFWQLYLHPGDSAGGRDQGAGRYGIQVRTQGGARDAVRQVNAVQRTILARSRLGIPMVPVEEALHGVAAPGATAFPQAIALAATWDTALMMEVAGAIASEARARGIRQVLSPVLNLASDARWGRVEETYGEDPLLATAMGRAFVRAFEAAGIVATPKHFVANVGEGGRDSYPIEWSERRLREEALPPFRAALGPGGARSVMAAYNSVDGSPASASPWLLTQVLRREWGFGGVTISDAGGVGGANVLHGTAEDYAHATARALTSGLDVIFQGDAASAGLFRAAFEGGRIPAAVIDSAVGRVLRLKFALGLFEAPFADTLAAAAVDADTLGRALARRAAVRSAVLLRNARGTLPLDAGRIRRLALIGADAAEGRLGGYSGPGRRVVSALEGLRARLGPERVSYRPGPGRTTPRPATIPTRQLSDGRGELGLEAEFFEGPDLAGAPVATRRDPAVDFHWTFLPPAPGLRPDWFSARWRGSLAPSVSGEIHVGAEGTGGYRLYLSDRLVIDEWTSQRATTRLVPVRAVAGRTLPIRLEVRQPVGNGRLRLIWDVGMVDSAGQRIREAVAAARGADVAVVMVGIEEGEFRDRASLGLPGRQEELIRRVAATGRPVVVVVVGGSPVTMPWLEHVGAVLDVWYPGEAGGEALAALLLGEVAPGGRLPVTFPVGEGQLPLGYLHKPTGRGDDYADLTGLPLFPFGFGLSYTTFEYSGLRVTPDTTAATGEVEVRFTIRNTGRRAGDEVAQLYLRDPVASVARPVMQLQGFARVTLAPGEAREVILRLGRDALEMLDERLVPVVEPGLFEVMVGASSRDIRLRGSFVVP